MGLIFQSWSYLKYSLKKNRDIDTFLHLHFLIHDGNSKDNPYLLALETFMNLPTKTKNHEENGLLFPIYI